MKRVIAIDGPAASGKSSVARELARRLGYVYVNTGAMYRAVTWLTVQRGADASDATAVLRLIETADLRFGVTPEGSPRESTTLVGGIDPTPFLSEPEVNALVSKVAAIPGVRSLLVARQREYAVDSDIVMEGRDIGTVVFSDTPWKFYIDASPEVRAQRRAAQGFKDDLAGRDRTDSSRAIAPLTVADGATVIDSSHLTVSGVVDCIVEALALRGYQFER